MLKLILLIGAAFVMPPPAVSQSCLCADINQRVEISYKAKRPLVPEEEDNQRGRTVNRFFITAPRKQTSSIGYEM